MKRIIILLLSAVLLAALALTGCAGDGGESSSSQEEAGLPSSSAAEEPDAMPTLYIGSVNSDGSESFTAYPFVGSGELTPESLIAAMANLTGWDLTLSTDDPVTSGPGGMTVSFAPESAIFTGPPEEQKDEFHMYSTEQLCYTIFDSVQKTLQENFSPADPSALDVYFCTDGSQEIVIENLGITLPIDTPYSHAMFEQLLMSATLGAGGETEPTPLG